MSRNREIPQRVLMASQVNGTAVEVEARGEEFFDSVVMAGSTSLDVEFYGGAIHSYYASGGTTGDNLVNPSNTGVLVDGQNILAQCKITTDPSAAVTDGTAETTAITVFRDGVDITEDLTDVPSFANIDISVSDGVYSLDAIEVDGGNSEDELQVGDVLEIETDSDGVVTMTVTDRNLNLAAGYYEAKKSFATSIKVVAGTPIYGRFTKIKIPSGNDAASFIITKG